MSAGGSRTRQSKQQELSAGQLDNQTDCFFLYAVDITIRCI